MATIDPRRRSVIALLAADIAVVVLVIRRATDVAARPDLYSAFPRLTPYVAFIIGASVAVSLVAGGALLRRTERPRGSVAGVWIASSVLWVSSGFAAFTVLKDAI